MTGALGFTPSHPTYNRHTQTHICMYIFICRERVRTRDGGVGVLGGGGAHGRLAQPHEEAAHPPEEHVVAVCHSGVVCQGVCVVML